MAERRELQANGRIKVRIHSFHLPADVQDSFGVFAVLVRRRLLRSPRPAAHLVSPLRNDAQIHDGRVVHVGFPIIQSGFKVVGEPEAEPSEFAFADQRSDAEGRNAGILLRHQDDATYFRLRRVALPVIAFRCSSKDW